MSKTLGQFLRELRTLDGYSQEFVASHLDIIRQTYSHYETGRILPPTDSLYKLSQLYYIPIERFFELSDHSKKHDDIHDTDTWKKTSADIVHNLPKSYSYRNKSTAHSIDLNKLTPNEMEMLFYYQQLDVQDKQDILEFMEIKYRHYKKKK